MLEHITVLKEEAVDALNIKDDGIYVDATLGGGGHSSLILSKLKKDIYILLIKMIMLFHVQRKNWIQLVIIILL